MEQSGNLKKPVGTNSMAIACRVCDKVFFDNLSLVYHFESHLEDENSNPSLQGHTMAALQSSWNWSVNRMSQSYYVDIPKMNYYLKSCSLPIPSATPPNVLPSNVVQMPMLNSMPPLRPSVDACQNLSQPNFRSAMNHKAVASSSTPLIHSQVGPRSGFARGMGTVPPLHLREQNGRRGRVAGHKRPQINQLKKSVQEIIVISDDEEEIDLTLKL
ncbi:hypothetical protein F511_20843 [Dorcoceras hygrometricum]|uniref:C2H2-type domain-containing protein n=1 Tax=Dorcoceras hygrometricum TaxID=472368 RepID=A0A2Z7CCX5_9LAMI|nr:hypothetical protein F511_20843 [Dorcoceras hygrometricum]